jgi:putative flavoprotein involved in K+ transport
MKKEKFKTVVIGAGQAGLAAAYYLRKINDDFIVLEEGNQIGNSWRQRWDSLRLFTPSQHDGLPGFPFPAIRDTLPTKDEMANYLSDYANKYSLPVQFDIKVIELYKASDNYEIITSNGKVYADNIIVATGTNPKAYIPAFAKDLDKSIVQIHSSEYKNPPSFPASNTLVVGAGTSGVEIAIELSSSRPTMISGHPTPHIPDFIFRYAGKPYWWFVHNVLTTNTPIGRKVEQRIISGGAPLISVSLKNAIEARVEHLPRVSGVQNGLPQLEDGRVLSVSSIVWATGYKPDFSWIKLDVTNEHGWPETERGISKEFRGLYFVGMVFQFGLTSGLVGGVGRDAAFVVNHLHKMKRSVYISSQPHV